jgi:hypothetical protein
MDHSGRILAPFSVSTEAGEAQTEGRAEARRGEPVTVLLRSGHMVKVGRDFDESAFARVVALLEHH